MDCFHHCIRYQTQVGWRSFFSLFFLAVCGSVVQILCILCCRLHVSKVTWDINLFNKKHNQPDRCNNLSHGSSFCLDHVQSFYLQLSFNCCKHILLQCEMSQSDFCNLKTAAIVRWSLEINKWREMWSFIVGILWIIHIIHQVYKKVNIIFSRLAISLLVLQDTQKERERVLLTFPALANYFLFHYWQIFL